MTLPRIGDTAGGVLDVDDGATLSTWLAAARRAPLLLVLDERDRGARVLTPVPIGDIAGPSPLAAPDTTPPPSGEVEAGGGSSAETPSMPPPPVLSMPRRGVMKKRSLRTERAEAPAAEPPAQPLPEAPRRRAPIRSRSPARPRRSWRRPLRPIRRPSRSRLPRPPSSRPLRGA